MAESRYKFFEEVWNSDIVHLQKGFPVSNLTDLFSGTDDISYSIPLEHQYRPDLIAQKFYGDPKLYWVLVYANNVRYCPDYFDTGTIMKIPKYERIRALV